MRADRRRKRLHQDGVCGKTPEIAGLQDLLIYQIKGISAYGHQARELGYYSDQVDDFYIQALEAITDDRMTVEELIRLTMRTGEKAIEFDEYFGFTDAEVKAMLREYHLEESYDEVREWYDGYRFGNVDVYCPWDVRNEIFRGADDSEVWNCLLEKDLQSDGGTGNDIEKFDISHLYLR